jgi:hypothetical protein
MNDEAVNYAFAGDSVSVVITGIDITHVSVGRYNLYIAIFTAFLAVRG